MGRLDGKVAVVTGGAKGIGKVYAAALAGEGARVVIADIADGAQTAADINKAHGQGTALDITTDISAEPQVETLMTRTVEEMGGLDIVVNNAALFSVLETAPITEIDVDLWDKVMAVNVRGLFLAAKHAAPHMKSQKSGKIINISSGLAFKGRPDLLHYVTSKGAVISFTRGLARELGPHNVCVNTLAPGFVKSESVLAQENTQDAFSDAVVQTRSFKRDSFPDDLIGALIFLSSADSDFITGQTLVVDGGSVFN
jgi:NAD(P)-dependent dehydrogenase (short-subunit alcohol dehydrogenase family)